MAGTDAEGKSSPAIGLGLAIPYPEERSSEVVRVGVVESVNGNSVAVTTLDLAVSEGTHSIDKAVEVLCR